MKTLDASPASSAQQDTQIDLALLLKLLGLKPDATEDEINAQIERLYEATIKSEAEEKDASGTGGVKTLSASSPASFSPEERKVMKAFGISPLVFACYNGGAASRALRTLSATPRRSAFGQDSLEARLRVFSASLESGAAGGEEQAAADEQVRRFMGITRAAWDRHSAD